MQSERRMQASPPLPEDLEHLRLLALFHRILGGIMALFSFLPLLYVVIGIAILATPPKPSPTQPPTAPQAMPGVPQAPVVHHRSSEPPPAVFGAVLVTVGVLGFAVALGVAICVFCVGRQLDKRTRYGYCFAIACIECLSAPLGTALGVFSLIVLTRPSVKAMFG